MNLQISILLFKLNNFMNVYEVCLKTLMRKCLLTDASSFEYKLNIPMLVYDLKLIPCDLQLYKMDLYCHLICLDRLAKQTNETHYLFII